MIAITREYIVKRINTLELVPISELNDLLEKEQIPQNAPIKAKAIADGIIQFSAIGDTINPTFSFNSHAVKNLIFTIEFNTSTEYKFEISKLIVSDATGSVIYDIIEDILIEK